MKRFFPFNIKLSQLNHLNPYRDFGSCAGLFRATFGEVGSSGILEEDVVVDTTGEWFFSDFSDLSDLSGLSLEERLIRFRKPPFFFFSPS